MSKASYSEYPAAETDLDPDLKHFWGIIRKRRATFIQAFLIVLVVGIAATVLSKPVYRTRAQFLVPATSSSISLIDSNNPIATMLAVAQPDAISTQVQVLQSEPFLNDAKREAGIVERPGVVPPSVKVMAVKDTNVVEITVDGGDRQEIVRLANKILELHLSRTDLLRSNGLEGSIDFVQKEKAKAYDDLQAALRKLVLFRRHSHVMQVNAEEEERTKQLIQLQNQVIEARSSVASTQNQIARLQQRIAAEPRDFPRPSIKDNPHRDKLKDKLSQLRIHRAELLEDLQPDSDPVKAVDEQIAEFKKALNAEPAAIKEVTYVPNPRREALDTKLTALEGDLVKFQENYTAASAELNGQQAKRNDLGAWEVDLNTLTQERDRLQTRYASLSDRLQDLEIRKNARAQTIRVIEAAAMPRKPVQPQPVLNLAISLILGLIIAAGVVFLQEYLDDRINEPEDVERLCALPSLGHVPLISGEQTRLVSALSANSPAGEAYRALRSSIGFAGLDAPIRRLQLTSASKGEGKSTTALNLATAMAIDGKRVILVDADLRRPSIHRMLDLPPSPGLSELLVGMKTLDEALQPTDVENLWVVAAGPIPPNPAELLGTRAFERIIEQLEERADIVIFDSPPCIPVTDPMVIATRMHGVVLVVHPGQTRKPVIKHTVELLERARARIVGVVFNRIEATRGGYYHQYYTDGYYSDSHQNGDSSRRNGKSHSLKGEGSDKLVSVARDGSDES